MKQNVLENFVKITRKHMCQSLRLATLLKKKFRHRCVVVNFAKFLRAAILKSTFSGCFFTSEVQNVLKLLHLLRKLKTCVSELTF